MHVWHVEKNCVIADGFSRAKLANDRAQVIHGMVTSEGCPLVSTLNGIDGVGSSDSDQTKSAFAPDGTGGWKGINPPLAEYEDLFDEYFILIDESNGIPAKGRRYRIILDSKEIIEGITDDEGWTKYANSDKRSPVTIEIFPPSEMQAD